MSRQHDSEYEDDPEPFQSSGDEWSLEKVKKEAGGRRKSARISRKAKIPIFNESEDNSDESSTEESKNIKNRKRPVGRPPAKKKKVTHDSDVSVDTSSNHSQEGNGLKKVNSKEKEVTSTDSDSRTAINSSKGGHRKFIPRTIYSDNFATGSFVILKQDAQNIDQNKHPCIWRIDGKALLQKYEAFDEDDKIRHKNTSVYTGWSPLDKDLYTPLTVAVMKHNNNNLTVEVQWDKLNITNADSDE
ncbi:uncharacterized protein LOC143198790 [Rhynchophorus ferrugineus]|uniref:Uncharacterized protein n=1 Tax=Rhynchophorus ferrugineus TaxID=354439 RepID=A0A834MAM6_RHYFE|nr:hypothetical protein GWI33_016138 [Rhynchophorus ferrugineus]